MENVSWNIDCKKCGTPMECGIATADLIHTHNIVIIRSDYQCPECKFKYKDRKKFVNNKLVV